jgi:adenylate cyclase
VSQRHTETRGTVMAAIEAKRNEQITFAEGSLLGERRAAAARLIMIAMFAIITNVPGIGAAAPVNKDIRAAIVGTVYSLLALATFFALRRVKNPDPRRSTIRPMMLAVVDFSFVTTMGVLAHQRGEYSVGMTAISSAILITFAVARINLWQVAWSVSLAMTGLFVTATYADQLNTRPAIFSLGGFVVLGFMVAVTNRAVRFMFRDLRRRDTLTRFLPQPVAERMLAIGPEALVPVQREVTILFTDIRGFTALSERLEPRAVLALLDDYFGRMSQVVKGHDGVVGKFLGDGMLAFWGVPDRATDHASKAVKAAHDMLRVLDELNRARAEAGDPAIRIGIGIHTGTVAAGMLGGSHQAEYTVIGDAVNVASRIEQLTKQHGVELLVSETTWAQLDDAAKSRVRKLAAEDIRGRTEPVVLYTFDEVRGQP